MVAVDKNQLRAICKLMKRILVLNGPNLNLLGMREPHIYGSETLADIEQSIIAKGKERGAEVICFQSNHEGALIEQIHSAMHGVDGIIINAAAYTHTSVALHDALSALSIPVIEVHLSNIYKRESFRHHSYISSVAQGVICGLGSKGYLLALDALL